MIDNSLKGGVLFEDDYCQLILTEDGSHELVMKEGKEEVPLTLTEAVHFCTEVVKALQMHYYGSLL